MSSYMNNLFEAFQKGLDRELIMADAAQQYADRWSVDKIISA